MNSNIVFQIHGVSEIRVTDESKHKDNAGKPWFCKRDINFYDESGELMFTLPVFGTADGFNVIDKKRDALPVCWHCRKPIEPGTAHHNEDDLHADCVADMDEGEEAHAEPPVFHRSEFE